MGFLTPSHGVVETSLHHSSPAAGRATSRNYFISIWFSPSDTCFIQTALNRNKIQSRSHFSYEYPTRWKNLLAATPSPQGMAPVFRAIATGLRAATANNRHTLQSLLIRTLISPHGTFRVKRAGVRPSQLLCEAGDYLHSHSKDGKPRG